MIRLQTIICLCTYNGNSNQYNKLLGNLFGMSRCKFPCNCRNIHFGTPWEHSPMLSECQEFQREQ